MRSCWALAASNAEESVVVAWLFWCDSAAMLGVSVGVSVSSKVVWVRVKGLGILTTSC